jgi:Na+/phosphate symporter
MKKFTIIFLIIGIAIVIFEQSREVPNLILQLFGIAFFMIGMMLLSSKIPSKNKDKDNDTI